MFGHKITLDTLTPTNRIEENIFYSIVLYSTPLFHSTLFSSILLSSIHICSPLFSSILLQSPLFCLFTSILLFSLAFLSSPSRRS